MRVLGLPRGFFVAVKRSNHDVPPEARTRALMVAWVNERRERGLTRDHTCRMLGISPRTYTRWRSILRRDGVRALADHRTPTRIRSVQVDNGSETLTRACNLSNKRISSAMPSSSPGHASRRSVGRRCSR